MKLKIATTMIVVTIFAVALGNEVRSQVKDDVIVSVTEAVIDQAEDITEPTYEQVEATENTEVAEGMIQETPEVVTYYTDEDIIMIAKVLWAECRGVPSDTEKACVAWTILNRVDADDSQTIADVIKAKHQFAWNSGSPVDDGLYDLAADVLERWNLEKNGQSDVGRVLPSDYLWFSGDGNHNYFRNEYKGGDIWDYSLPSPYES